MMEQAILNFADQFKYQPKIENKKKLKNFKKFVVAGMGGSALAGGLIKAYNPSIDLSVHRNYGLPSNSKDRLIIVSSYSGNTEEAVDVFNKAIKNKLHLAVITTGGKLLELACKYDIPYIQMPNTGIQPRMATGFSFIAMMKLTGQHVPFVKINPAIYENTGKLLARKLKNNVPIIYSSENNQALSYIWKISFNETGKVPAFCNVIPELNHNEMNGFDVQLSFSKKFQFVFIEDSNDDLRVQKRMKILKRLYNKRGFKVETISLKGKDWFTRTFSCAVLANWTAFYIARQYGLEAEQVPMIEEFKKML